MVLVWDLLLMLIRVVIQTVGMLKAKALFRLQLGLLLIGVLFVGFPDGAEIINLTAAIFVAAAMVPYGTSLIKGREQKIAA